MSKILLNKNITSFSSHKIYAFIKEFSVEDLSYLNERELEIWNDKKRLLRNGNNWVIGRVTAKYSIAQCLDINPEEMKNLYIQNSSNGAPYFSDKRMNNLVFSISHCSEVGFSCSSTIHLSIGCDIEKIRKRHPKFPNYYLSVSEENQWIKEVVGEDRNTILTIAWSCKEACFKCLSSIEEEFTETINDIKIYPFSERVYDFKFVYRNKEGYGYWGKYKNFIISIAVLL